MFSRCAKGYLTRNYAAYTIVEKKLITDVIPHFGISLCIESGQITHFTIAINHLLTKTLGHSLKFYTLYHPQSPEQVEHKNFDIKRF